MTERLQTHFEHPALFDPEANVSGSFFIPYLENPAEILTREVSAAASMFIDHAVARSIQGNKLSDYFGVFREAAPVQARALVSEKVESFILPIGCDEDAAFDAGYALLEATTRHNLEQIESRYQACKSGEVSVSPIDCADEIRSSLAEPYHTMTLGQWQRKALACTLKLTRREFTQVIYREEIIESYFGDLFQDRPNDTEPETNPQYTLLCG